MVASLRRRSARTGIVLAIMLAGVSVAWGYFRPTGAGSGTVGTTAVQTIVLSPGAPTAPIYPGGHGDVAVTIDNPNPFRVHVGSLSLATGQGTGGFHVDAGHSACALSTLSFAAQTNSGVGWTVPPKVGSTDGALSVDLASALAMSASAVAACQGASFDVYLAAGP